VNHEAPPWLEFLLDQLADKVARRLHELQAAAPAEALKTGSPWMNVKSAATHLDWSPQRLYKLTARGEVPHYKQDGRLLFHRAELDQWLCQHAQPATGSVPGNELSVVDRLEGKGDRLGHSQTTTTR
jgi:excisionase family DNA binding protein